MNGSARAFEPNTHQAPRTIGLSDYYQKSITPSSVTSRPSPSLYIEARLCNLEEQYGFLLSDVNKLAEMYDSLYDSVDKLKKDCWPLRVSPSQESDPPISRRSALSFGEEFDRITREAHEPLDSGADQNKTNGVGIPKCNNSVSPHLKTASTSRNEAIVKSVPPHLRGVKKADGRTTIGAPEPFADKTKDKYEPLVTDGPVDTSIIERPAPILSSPSSTLTAIQSEIPIMDMGSLTLVKEWKPHYLTTLRSLSLDVLSNIPSKDMVTFHPEFIKNHLAGVLWSPGLRFINTDGPVILRNRTYYELDPKVDPYLPSAPGYHGVKLTPFFNKSPEESYGELFAENANTYENVPMFVEQSSAIGRIRYVYFGNYSQTRWSDKLDYDTMKTKVPQYVKEYWATKLSDATLREEWVTEALKKHFFPKPEYQGRIYAASADTTTVDTEAEIICNQAMSKDVKRYVESLRDWEREANMKTALIKKQAILNAFDAADVDDPPALRLWWEYLECVDWNKDFYNLLVTLQSRDEERYLG